MKRYVLVRVYEDDNSIHKEMLYRGLNYKESQEFAEFHQIQNTDENVRFEIHEQNDEVVMSI